MAYHSRQNSSFFLVYIIRTYASVRFPRWSLTISKYSSIESLKCCLDDFATNFIIYLFLCLFWLENLVERKTMISSSLFLNHLDRVAINNNWCLSCFLFLVKRSYSDIDLDRISWSLLHKMICYLLYLKLDLIYVLFLSTFKIIS